MKKSLFFAGGVLVIFGLFVGCSVSLSDDVVLDELYNDNTLNTQPIPILSSAEMDKLNSIEGEALEIIGKYFTTEEYGTQGLGIPIVDISKYNEQFLDELKNLLQREFGDDYKKFIIEGESKSDTSSRTLWTGPAGTLKIIHGSSILFLGFDARYVILPWGTYGWGFTVLEALDGTDLRVDLSETWYGDEVTTWNMKRQINGYMNRNQGNMKYGFFPRLSYQKTAHGMQDSLLVSTTLPDGIFQTITYYYYP